MHVYRPPFRYAQQAARIDWQPAIRWEIEVFSASIVYETYQARIGLYPTINLNSPALTVTGNPVGIYQVVAGGVAGLTVAAYPVTIQIAAVVATSPATLTVSSHAATIAHPKDVTTATAGLRVTAHPASLVISYNLDADLVPVSLTLTAHKANIYRTTVLSPDSMVIRTFSVKVAITTPGAHLKPDAHITRLRPDRHTTTLQAA